MSLRRPYRNGEPQKKKICKNARHCFIIVIRNFGYYVSLIILYIQSGITKSQRCQDQSFLLANKQMLFPHRTFRGKTPLNRVILTYKKSESKILNPSLMVRPPWLSIRGNPRHFTVVKSYFLILSFLEKHCFTN